MENLPIETERVHLAYLQYIIKDDTTLKQFQNENL